MRWCVICTSSRPMSASACRRRRSASSQCGQPSKNWMVIFTAAMNLALLVARALAFGARGDEFLRILVEACLAAGGAEVVGLPIMGGAVVGGGRIHCPSTYGIGWSCLACHVVSLARL